jgi:hypothetical protein
VPSTSPSTFDLALKSARFAGKSGYRWSQKKRLNLRIGESCKARVGPYEVGGLLGAGGIGRGVPAKDTRLSRDMERAPGCGDGLFERRALTSPNAYYNTQAYLAFSRISRVLHGMVTSAGGNRPTTDALSGGR